jgi:hypothetical protein
MMSDSDRRYMHYSEAELMEIRQNLYKALEEAGRKQAAAESTDDDAAAAQHFNHYQQLSGELRELNGEFEARRNERANE